MTGKTHTGRIDGLAEALGAHAIWGVMPLYLILVREVPPLEFVAWRVIFTLPLCLAIIIWRKQGADLLRVLKDIRTLLILLAAALIVGINWVLYVVAIQTGHVYAASLGYYILPLMMMILGLVILREKMSRLQWVSAALAATGVAFLAAGALTTLWFSVTIAVTFGVYGLIRKMVSVGPLVGLTIETMLLTIPAICMALWFAATPNGSSITQGPQLAIYIALGGPMTAIPLILFTAAARKMDYTMIGFLQFISPTIVFLLGMFLFKEKLSLVQLSCFVLIWASMVLFVWHLFGTKKQTAQG